MDVVEVVKKLAREFRLLHAAWLVKTERAAEAVSKRLAGERKALYANARDSTLSATILLLRDISSDALRDAQTAERLALAESSAGEQLRLAHLKDEIETLLSSLDGIVPWKLRYCMELDPDAADDGKVILGGGLITDENNQSVWHDYCSVCLARIENETVVRYRELETGQVNCEPCHALLGLHEEGYLKETMHPVVARLTVGNKSLSEAMEAIFKAYAHRPCFDGQSYDQVWLRAVRLASFLITQPTKRVGILLRGSFCYIADLACILAHKESLILSVKYHGPMLDEMLTECGLVFINDEDNVSIEAGNKIIVRLDQWQCFGGDENFNFGDNSNDESEIYTIFSTSGSAGATPKGVCISRKAFLSDFQTPSTPKLLVHASFLEPCWGADRLGVYQTLFNGGRVEFCSGQMETLFSELSVIRPTHFFAPPAVFESMQANRTNEEIRQILGSRVRTLGSGGARVSPSLISRFKSVFVGCSFAVGYGISEVGGISSNGVVRPGVEVQILNPEIDPDSGALVGEILVKANGTMMKGYADGRDSNLTESGFFRTGDIGRLDKGNLEVLGRNNLSVVKLQNGTWLSCEALENEIQSAHASLIESILIHVLSNDDICAIVKFQNVKDKGLPWHLYRVNRVVEVSESLETTASLKLARKSILCRYEKEIELALPVQEASSAGSVPDSSIDIAKQLLGVDLIDESKSILENGATSIQAAKFASYFGDQSCVFQPIQSLKPRHLVGSASSAMGSKQFANMLQFDFDLPLFSVMAESNDQQDGILLTGATGFVGSHLLIDLLERQPLAIYCLVRAKKNRPVGIHAHPRVHIIEGDFGVDLFGLSMEAYVDLCSKISCVIHCGAQIDFRANYETLRNSNVLGTLRMVQFCVASGPHRKHLTYISSESAGGPITQNGYASSKFVGEYLVRKHCEDEELFDIVRLPFVSFDRISGHSNSSDWLDLFLVSCIKLNAFPNDFNVMMPTIPVNELRSDHLPRLESYSWSLDVLIGQIRRRTTSNSRSLPTIDLLSEMQSLPAAAVASMLSRMVLTPMTSSAKPQLCLTDEQVDLYVANLKMNLL